MSRGPTTQAQTKVVGDSSTGIDVFLLLNCSFLGLAPSTSKK